MACLEIQPREQIIIGAWEGRELWGKMGSLHDAILDSVGITAILVPHRINVFSQRELYVRNLAPSGVSNGICVQTFKSIQMISAMRCCAVIARVLLFSKGVGTC